MGVVWWVLDIGSPLSCLEDCLEVTRNHWRRCSPVTQLGNSRGFEGPREDPRRLDVSRNATRPRRRTRIDRWGSRRGLSESTQTTRLGRWSETHR